MGWITKGIVKHGVSLCCLIEVLLNSNRIGMLMQNIVA